MKKTVTRIISVVLLFMLTTLILSSCSPSLIKMKTFHPWLEDSSKVVKVEEIHSYYGIAPGQEMASYFSEDVDVISEYMDWFANTSLIPTIPKVNVGGGGSTRRVFTFEDGSTKEIYTKHGIYYSTLLSFNIYGSSDFKASSNMTQFYRFNAENAGYSIYTYEENPTLVKNTEDGLAKLGFIPLKDAQEPKTEPTHYMEVPFGKVYIYSDTLCYIEREFDEYFNGYYELYGASFDELMK